MRVLGTTLAMLLGLWMVQAASADEGYCGAPSQCGRCGGHSACQKYCKTVPDVKEVKKTVWVVKYEDFCAPRPGLPCLHRGGCAQDGCDDGCQGGGCGGKCEHCGVVRTKKTLEKKEITEKIPCWKCVVVYACGDCASAGMAPVKAGDTTPAAPLPPSPKKLPPPHKSPRQAALDLAPEPRLTVAY